MKTFLALMLISLFAIGVTWNVAIAGCGLDHCKAGDVECEKKKNLINLSMDK